MDTERFDTFARELTLTHSRRGALASVLGGTLALLGLAETTAKKKHKKKKHASPGSPPPPGPPSPPAPTCSDGIHNGSETDVDCGGTCPRCATGKSCLSRNDCAVGTVCPSGTCRVCTYNGNDCGGDADGVCGCIPPGSDGPLICVKGVPTGPTVGACGDCPTGTYCLYVGGQEYRCYTPCGAD